MCSVLVYVEGFTTKRGIRRWYTAQRQEEEAWISASIILEEEGKVTDGD